MSLKSFDTVEFPLQCFFAGYHQFFQNLSSLFPSSFHASVPIIHFQRAARLFCWKAKHFSIGLKVNKAQNTVSGLQGFGGILFCFPHWSQSWLQVFWGVFCPNTLPCVFCTCCSFTGQEPYRDWWIINTQLASVINQLSQESVYNTTKLKQIHWKKWENGCQSCKLPRMCFEEDFRKWQKKKK